MNGSRMTDKEINEALWNFVRTARDILARHDACPDCWPHVDRWELLEELEAIHEKFTAYAKEKRLQMTYSEINEAVARKLGWKDLVRIGDGLAGFRYGEGLVGPIQHGLEKPYLLHQQCAVPDFCHSITAAWEIVNWIGEKCSSLNLTWDEEVGKWEFSWISSGKRFTAIEQTAPMAICLAFLKINPSSQ